MTRTLSAVCISLLLTACATSNPPPERTRDNRRVEPATPHQTKLCPRITVHNAPRHDHTTRQLQRPQLRACLKGVLLDLVPAPTACLTSGYGRRNGRFHRGLDYQARPAVAVVAAANGTVAYKGTRAKDFGNVVYVDHGDGVYTAYAHLAAFAPGLTIGSRIKRGERLGIMGNSGKTGGAIHLHFEARTGAFDENRPSTWFLLDSHDLFALPAQCRRRR